MFKIVSFNINGLRARLAPLQALLETHRPDVVGLQETKVSDEEFPRDAIEQLGYQVLYHGQKGHYGVALLSRQTPQNIHKGFPWDTVDAQRRVVGASYLTATGQSIQVINAYFPQGESRDHPVKFPLKQAFYADMRRWLDESYAVDAHVVVMGDMNIAPQDLDIGITDDNARRWLRSGKCSFLPEERAWMQQLHAWGLADSYRLKHPDEMGVYSWFDYRSRGFEREPKQGLRIDQILVSQSLQAAVEEVGIDYVIRAMDKPSDHCPVWAGFAL